MLYNVCAVLLPAGINYTDSQENNSQRLVPGAVERNGQLYGTEENNGIY